MSDNEEEVTREPFEANGNDGEDSNSFRFDNELEEERNHLLEDDMSKQNGIHSENFNKCSSISSFSSECPSTKESKLSRLFNSHLDEFKSSKSESSKSLIIPTSTTSDCIYHKGVFYQKGDIVALRDMDDKEMYFAQLTGFLQDQFCEKSASIVWLIPNRPTSRDIFEPDAYEIGYEEKKLRKLDSITFVRHCPFDFYKNKGKRWYNCNQLANEHIDFTSQIRTRNDSFIWTTMSPTIVPK